MFSVTELGIVPGHHSSIHKLNFNGHGICNIQKWGFNSCAVMNLQGFGYYLTEFDVDKMFQFLNEWGTTGEYKPKEYYFLLSKRQYTTVEPLKKMVEHPNVKMLDTFTNKSHDSTGVSLFRYSEKMDFPMQGVQT
jgi:hypothetical protein